MNAAGIMTMVYGFERGIWDGISFVITTRGNHALGPPKRREFALFVLKIKLFFFLIQVFFRENTIISGNISPNPPRSGYINLFGVYLLNLNWFL